MNLWWQHWNRALTPSECLKIRSYALQIKPVEGSVGRGSDNRIDEKIRKSEVRWLNRQDPELKWIFEKMEYIFKTSNDNAWGFHITDFREIQFGTYRAEDKGHYDWHVDTFWKSESPSQRKLSMVIQLCDPEEYEGGRLQFEYDDMPKDIFSNQGDIVVFPGVLKHKANTVTKGIRHSLTTWCYGPNFR